MRSLRLPPNVWLRIRVVFERRRMGLHPDKAKVEFQAAMTVAEAWAAPGMIDWRRRVEAQVRAQGKF